MCFLLLSFQLAVTITIIVHTYSFEFERLVGSSFFGSREAYLPVLVILSVIPLAGFVGICVLFSFHAYISALGVTTYKWIINRRIKAEKEAEAADAVRLKNISAKQEEERKRYTERMQQEKSRKSKSQSQRSTNQHASSALRYETRQPSGSESVGPSNSLNGLPPPPSLPSDSFMAMPPLSPANHRRNSASESHHDENSPPHAAYANSEAVIRDPMDENMERSMNSDREDEKELSVV